MEEKFKIGISSCLLGNEVRWNSGHKHDKYLTGTLGRFVDYVPVCPEVEAGFGVPRESFRLVGDPEAPLQMLVSSIDYSPYVGRLGIGKITAGTLNVNKEPVPLALLPPRDGMEQPEKNTASFFVANHCSQQQHICCLRVSATHILVCKAHAHELVVYDTEVTSTTPYRLLTFVSGTRIAKCYL